MMRVVAGYGENRHEKPVTRFLGVRQGVVMPPGYVKRVLPAYNHHAGPTTRESRPLLGKIFHFAIRFERR